MRARSLDALRHPIRVRIVEALTDWGRLSPSEIVNRSLCADVATMRGKTPKQQLSIISYHCRQLEKIGLVTVVHERRVRGATQHFYEANVDAYFSDEQWAALNEDQRHAISQVVWQRFIAQVEHSMQRELFDRRSERWMTWGPLDLDERGWRDFIDCLREAFANVERIREEAGERLTVSDAPPIRATYGLLGFESPRRGAARTDRPSPLPGRSKDPVRRVG